MPVATFGRYSHSLSKSPATRYENAVQQLPGIYGRTGHECPSRRVFLYHTSRTSWVINHIPIERGVSCGGNQVLFINFGVRTQKIRRAYLNGQIVSEFVSGCLNLNLNFRLNFKYVSEHDVGFPNHYCRPHNSSWIKSYDLSKTPLSARFWAAF